MSNYSIYAVIRDPGGYLWQGLLTVREYIDATYAPDVETVYMHILNAGTKEAARQLAADILDRDRETVDAGGPCLSYGEWAEISATFERLARRFGLLREFRENGII